MANSAIGITRRAVIASALALKPEHARFAFSAADPDCLDQRAYPVPIGSGPHDVAPSVDAVGVWFTAQRSGQLGLLDPFAETVELIDLGDSSAPHGVIVGPDGSPWITDGGRDEIIRVDHDTKEITRHSTGLERASLNTAAFDRKGALWFTGQSGYLGRLDPGTGDVITIESPRDRGPYGICATPKGAIWFVSLAGSYLGRLRFDDGKIVVTEHDQPTPGAGPRRVWSDSKGRLWIAEWLAGQLAMYDPAERQWREWKMPGESPKAYAVYVDEWDIVWLTDFGTNAIVRFDPELESFDSLPLPHAGGNIRQLNGRAGEIWGAESGADHLVVVRTACAGP